MKIEDKLFNELLRQSRINVTEKEKEELEELFELANDTIKTVKEEKILNVKKPTELELEYLREDEVKPSMSREDALLNAPDKDSLSFIVPRVVE